MGMTPPPSDPPQDPVNDDIFDDLSDAETLESYHRLRGVVDDYRRTEVSQDREASGLKARIMTIVEDETARGPSTPLLSSANLLYSMTTSSLRAQVKAAVDEEPGIRARRVKITAENVPGQPLDLQVTLTMAAWNSQTEFSSRLRERITHRMEQIIGVKTGTVDLIVEDVHDD